MVDIGREMRLEVIAEGVETEGQLALLRAFGCRVFQGFLFSKALDKAAFLALLGGNAKSLAHPRYGK
ncbi:MAG: EAL domain-containing protein [Gammaproteobacteria bacterium]